MRRWICIMCLALCAWLEVFAQEIQVKRFTEAQEIFWIPEQRLDNNGVICALVRVVVPADSRARFKGNVIGKVEYEGNEYRVYLSQGSRYLRVHYPGCETLLVDFQSFGYEGVKSKGVYELVLVLPERKPSTLSEEEYQQLIAEALVQQKKDNFVKAITLYEAYKKKLMDQGEQGYAQTVQENINYCKRCIALRKLGVDSWSKDLSEGLCLFRVDGKLGFVDSVGNLITSPIYEKAWEPRDGVVWVMKDGLWGSINLAGEMIVPCQYNHISNYGSKEYALNRCLQVSKEGEYGGVIDYKTGEEILPCRYFGRYWPHVGSGGYVCYEDKKGRPIFINQQTGKEQFKLAKDIKFGGYLPLGYCQVYKEKRGGFKMYGLVDKQGNEVFPCEYYEFESPDELIDAPVWLITVQPCNSGYFEPNKRLYNLKQRIFVGSSYSDIYIRSQCTETLVVVYNYYNGMESWGVLNWLTGVEVIPPTHRIRNIELPQSNENPITAQSFQSAQVYLYDVEGNRYDAPKSEDKLNYQCGYTRVKRNGKYGYANAKGELILPCVYDVGNPFMQHGDIVAAAVEVGKDSFYITPEGKRIESEVIEAIYE